MPNPFKVSLYIRVSTDKQANEGDSMDEQERELKRFCEFKGYQIHRIHIEPGRSAKDTKRPEYQKMIADIEAEKINAVVVKKLDRLSRSLLDFEGFMTVAQKHKVEFVSIKENFDTTNSMGTAMLRVALVFAQLEREQTSERVSDVMNYRAQQGLNNGGVKPYGYSSISKELVPDKKEAKVVQTMFQKYTELKSIVQVAEYLNALGLRNRSGQLWTDKRIHDVLNRPVYAGKVQWKDSTYPGIHQPLISEQCFNQVQAIFQSRHQINRASKIGGILRGMIFCGCCQSSCTVNYTKKRNGLKINYYRCTNTMSRAFKNKKKCAQGFYLMRTAEERVIAHVLGFSEESKLASLQKQIDRGNAKTHKEIVVLQHELTQLEKQLALTESKREKYLDSLVTQQFKPSERQLINNKIEEYALEERRVKANIHRLQFELSDKTDRIESIDRFKQELIAFKINHTAMTPKELGEWFRGNVERVTYTKEVIQVDFKRLK